MVFDFFYDAQIRRYLLQFMRIFSLIKVQSAPDENNAVTEQTVPVYYGDMNRMVAHILRQNSENTAVPSTAMSVVITNIARADNYRRYPYFVGKINIDERKFEDGEYTSEMGNQYSIDRYMPSPYLMTVRLDIWTINTTTKLQILEQIMTIFNPGLQIKQHENMLDWSVMTEVTLTDYVWSSRSIPQGTDVERDVASLTFEIPVMINPPARVKRKSLIEEIVTTIYDVAEIPDDELNRIELDSIKSCFEPLGQIIVTPGNHSVSIGIDGIGSNQLKLLSYYGNEDDAFAWEELITQYGEYQSDTSFITLKRDPDIEDFDNDIMGQFQFTSTPDVITFTVDTDTLPSIIPSGPIDDIIDPTLVYPGSGLPVAATGQRYLLLNDIPVDTGTNPWGNVQGSEHDIIEYNGAFWIIKFNANTEDPDQYVSIAGDTSAHYHFNGSEWNHTFFGTYGPGYWRITLQEC
jgi:hypothetical protein